MVFLFFFATFSGVVNKNLYIPSNWYGIATYKKPIMNQAVYWKVGYSPEISRLVNPDNGGLEHDFPDLTWVIFRCLSPLVFRCRDG